MDFGIKMAELEHEQMSLHHHERAPVPWKCGACFLRADNTPPVGHTQSAMERAAKTTGGEFGAPPEMGAHTSQRVGAVCCPQWKRKTHASGVPKAFQVTCFGETLPSCSVGELDRGEKRKGESKRGKRKCLGAQNCCFGGRPSESGSSEGGARSEFVVGV